MSFQSNKAPGYDKVPMAVIKDSLSYILPVLTDIYSETFVVISGISRFLEIITGSCSTFKGWWPRVSKKQSPCFFASSYVKDTWTGRSKPIHYVHEK